MRRAIAYLIVFGGGGLFWATVSVLRPATTPAASAAAAPVGIGAKQAPYDATLADRTVEFWAARERSDPQGATGVAQLAAAYLRRANEQGDVDDIVRAESAARRSLVLRNGRNGPAYMTLSRALSGQHRFAEAKAAADKLAALTPDDPTQADYLRAECLMETSDYDGAGRLLARAARRYPDDPYGKAMRARMCEIYGAPERALKLYTEARDAAGSDSETPRPTLAWFCSRRAACLAAMGHIEDAEAGYREALAVWDRDVRTRVALARLYAARGDWAGARDEAEHAARLAPSQDAALLLVDAYAKTGNAAASAQQMRLVTESGSASLHAHGRALAQFLADRDQDIPQALSLMRTEVATRGNEVYTQDALAWVLFKAGKYDEADAAMKRALAHGICEASFLYHAGRIALARGDRDTARRYLSHALRINPYFAPSPAPKEAKALLAELNGKDIDGFESGH